MDLAFMPPLYPPKGNRAIYEVKPFSSALHRNLYSQRTSPCLATAATQTSQVFLLNPLELIFQLFIYFWKKLHFSILSFSFIFNVPPNYQFAQLTPQFDRIVSMYPIPCKSVLNEIEMVVSHCNQWGSFRHCAWMRM